MSPCISVIVVGERGPNWTSWSAFFAPSDGMNLIKDHTLNKSHDMKDGCHTLCSYIGLVKHVFATIYYCNISKEPTTLLTYYR